MTLPDRPTIDETSGALLPLPQLGHVGQEALARAIRELDPEGEFVTLDVDAKQVTYSPRIRQHELIRDYVGEEEPVRAYLVAWLCTMGLYPPEALELERPYSYGRGGQAQVDVRISHADAPERAFAIIETKPPGDWGGSTDPRIRGQLFALTAENPDTSVLSLVTAQVGADGRPFLNTVTVDYRPGLTFQRWERDGRPHVEDFPVNYQEPTQVPYAPGTDRDLRTDLTRPQLDRIRRELHNKLWGGSRDDNQIYAWLVRLFLTKIHDEKVTNEGEAYRFQVRHRGTDKESASDTLKRVNECYQEAYQRYVDQDVTQVDPLDESLYSAEEVQWVVETLQGFSLTAAGRTTGDLLGTFFEAITREGFKQSKGLFFTHYNLAIFMLEVLGIGDLAEEKLTSRAHTNDRLPYVIDPSCGSGTFLLASMRLISQHIAERRPQLSRNRDVREQLASKFPENAPNEWAKEFIYGVEKREDLAISTKVNMVLHRDGHTHIYHDDGLAELDALATKHREQKFRAGRDADGVYEKPVAETFDVVVTNPPFSITLDGSVKERFADNFQLAADRNSENLFLERWYQLLKHGGRLAAVLPESFFSTTENLAARLFLFQRFNVRAVVSLPVHAFQPWTPTRTSLLFAQKKTPAEEIAWTAAFSAHFAQITADRDAVLAATRIVIKPGQRTTPEQLAAHARTATAALERLGLPVPDGDPTTQAWAVQAQTAAKAVSPESSAFAATVYQIGGDSYLGVIVGEVGYRRTKRAENASRNDLFHAVQPDGEGGTEPVRNLNDAKNGWQIVVTDGATDALAVLRREALWR
ncbi:HsdM family class I SAM-dependent methyltransferase [Planosporangium mesophilum]|uniref:DNA methylase adenine-specific domain-containing protein n=1 Tax=Planosporangium mesophilum TaxID=689768 RepID=A0A8J3X2X0_9ACTN|nr:N-6 DNA methylase [Planosporangium mesophilum]NJC83689.1 N-6 DNA methylase [Planosporangium mesophilum]GII25356.1 hypothetical protein Pme01_49530 [Planosporangium mesophilum]